MAIDDLPDGYVVQSPQVDPTQLPEGYVAQAPNDPSNSHTLAMLGGDLLRSPVNAAAGIVDTTARVPTWAYNTLRPSWAEPIDYPPSINQAVQSQLDKVLPTPQNTGEQILSSGARNAVFGPAGVVGGMAAGGIYSQPYGQQNINVDGRDIGISPSDIGATVAGMASQGALSPKPFMMNDIKNSEAGRLAKINMDQGVPVYPTDVATQGPLAGILQFLNSTPLSGKVGRGAEQQTALNAAAVKSMGARGGVLSPPVMGATADRLGQGYQDFAKNNNVTPQAGSSMLSEIGTAQNDWGGMSADNARRLNWFVDNKVMPRMNGDLSMDGTAWHNVFKDAGEALRNTDDPELASGYKSIREASSNAMQNSLPPDQWAPFQQLNSQYRAMLALESATKQGLGTGNAAPQALLSGVSKIYPDTIYNDPNTLPQLAQGAQLLKQAQRNSDKYTMGQHKMPAEAGQFAAYAATPFGAIFNRTMNTPITPLDWSNPYGAGFGRGVRGAAIPFSISPQTQGQ
jgi:hypothetical protein